MQANQNTMYHMAISAANEHGDESGTDIEVRDLQDMLESAIVLLSDEALDKLAVDYAANNEYFKLEEWRKAFVA